MNQRRGSSNINNGYGENAAIPKSGLAMKQQWPSSSGGSENINSRRNKLKPASGQTEENIMQRRPAAYHRAFLRTLRWHFRALRAAPVCAPRDLMRASGYHRASTKKYGACCGGRYHVFYR
jgi:hypothetical protein